MSEFEPQFLVRVENIKCGGCAQHIKDSLGLIEGVKATSVDIESGLVSVFFEGLEDTTKLQQQIQQKLLDKGYPEVGSVEGMKAVGVKAKSFVSCAIGKMSK
ncbi:MAG: heavy-metal-associated domain-containing protein [Thiomicrorhabdus sp.]|nr:heavy-metal-associated domain-containing protein [Thiomicrorhabdus sp.]